MQIQRSIGQYTRGDFTSVAAGCESEQTKSCTDSSLTAALKYLFNLLKVRCLLRFIVD